MKYSIIFLYFCKSQYQENTNTFVNSEHNWFSDADAEETRTRLKRYLIFLIEKKKRQIKNVIGLTYSTN